MRKIALAVVVTLLCACTSIDCPVNNTIEAVYTLGGTVTQLGGTDTLTIWAIRSSGNDTILNSKTSASTFQLPLSYNRPTDELVFCLTDNAGTRILDTLYVDKTNEAHFEAVDCSPAFFHTLTTLRCTHHMLDSVSIAQPTVNYDTSTTHIYLYFHSGD